MVVDEQGNPSLSLRSLMMQEMIRGGVLLEPNISHRLDQDAFESIERAFHETMPVLSRGIRDGVDGLLEVPGQAGVSSVQLISTSAAKGWIMQTILFRADGSSVIGVGHIVVRYACE